MVLLFNKKLARFITCLKVLQRHIRVMWINLYFSAHFESYKTINIVNMFSAMKLMKKKTLVIAVREHVAYEYYLYIYMSFRGGVVSTSSYKSMGLG